MDNEPEELVLDEATWYSHFPRSRNRILDQEADVREWATRRDVIAQHMWNDRPNIAVDNVVLLAHNCTVLFNYQMLGEDGGNEYDIIAQNSPTTESTNSNKKRKCVSSKNASKAKVSRSNMNDEVSASIVRLRDVLAARNLAAPIHNNAKTKEPSNPNALLWKHIEDLTITTKDKLAIAAFSRIPSKKPSVVTLKRQVIQVLKLRS